MSNTNTLEFNESEWLKMLFIISDTQSWIDEMEKRIIHMVPLDNKRKLFRPTYRLRASVFAHILERHYYKIPRHPEASKFNIPVHEILYFIREAGTITPDAIAGCLNFERIIDAGKPIGFNTDGEDTDIITVITDPAGNIKSAFPGR